MRMRFRDRIVLLTGAAGGIGQALIKRFATEGASIALTDVDESGCQRAHDIAERHGAEVFVRAMDLRDATACQRLVEETVERFGAIDILLNNAGVIPRGTIEETTDEMWLAAIGVNLNAAFYLSRAAIPAMKTRPGAAMVNTCSVWGTQPGPGHLAYCTSKGALAAFTQSLGRDCAPLGIRVNGVCPHEVDTPMLRSGFARRGLDPDRALDDLARSVPLGHVAAPEEVADVIAFLASDDARYVAGTLLEVTGAKRVGV